MNNWFNLRNCLEFYANISLKESQNRIASSCLWNSILRFSKEEIGCLLLIYSRKSQKALPIISADPPLIEYWLQWANISTKIISQTNNSLHYAIKCYLSQSFKKSSNRVTNPTTSKGWKPTTKNGTIDLSMLPISTNKFYREWLS